MGGRARREQGAVGYIFTWAEPLRFPHLAPLLSLWVRPSLLSQACIMSVAPQAPANGTPATHTPEAACEIAKCSTRVRPSRCQFMPGLIRL